MDEIQHEMAQDRTCITQKREMDISPKHARQQLFLEHFVKFRFNKTAACKSCGIGLRTVYSWLENDLDFKELYQELIQTRNDLVENRLLSLVESGNVIATIYASKVWCGLSEDHVKEDYTNADPILMDTQRCDAIAAAAQASFMTMSDYKKHLALNREIEALRKKLAEYEDT